MKKKTLLAGLFGILSAVIYFSSVADFAFPGLSAHLMACWNGLETDPNHQFLLMRAFTKLCGGGNLIAPICGVISVASLFYIVSAFVGWRLRDVATIDAKEKERLSLIAAGVSVIVFMLTPAVRAAATHLEPTLFDFTWVALAFATSVFFFHRGNGVAWFFYLIFGAMFGLGFCDSSIFLLLLPGYIIVVVAMTKAKQHQVYVPLFLFLLMAVVFMFVASAIFDAPVAAMFKNVSLSLRANMATTVSIFILFFTTIPFVAILFSSSKAFPNAPSVVQWVFHLAMTFIAILATVTPLSPSQLMEPYCVFPIASSAFAAMLSGYLAAFWWRNRRRAISIVTGSVFAFALLVFFVLNLFLFDGDSGAFADKVAEQICSDLGSREWFVTDGLLDDHLKLVANRTGRKLHLISLAKESNEKYLEKLAEVVKAEGIGGERNTELLSSLKLGVLPFLQDWLASDLEVAKEVAIFGAPDIWFLVNKVPVPEIFFFGADTGVNPDWTRWNELDKILKAPKGWGSYHDKTTKPTDRLRLLLRRHVGFVANNRGVYLQDQGKNDAAFDMYELVLNKIDRDNVCSIFNEVAMVEGKYAKANAKRRELERIIKGMQEDKNRRYILWRLGTYYGYIRHPDVFVKMSYGFAQSGRPGEALSQIRRAMDLVPTDKRTILLNMMATLYANENDREMSRKVYEQVLTKDAENHDALIGLMRLELKDGNTEKAIAYLERAAKSAPKGSRAQIEQAMLLMMKGDTKNAEQLLTKMIDQNSKDNQVWAFLAAIAIQKIDAKDTPEAERAKLIKDLENRIIPEMEKRASGAHDYFLQATKGFMLLRQKEDKRKEARDAFAVAAQSRPDVESAQDIVLELDISLNDKEDAEYRARKVLRRNRNAPLANYVLGSIALSNNNLAEAEVFLRKAANAPKPVVVALNDLAEVLRRQHRYDEAEQYARKAVKLSPNFYVAWDTLGAILIDAKKDLDEAESCIRKACQLSKDSHGNEADVRMLVSLARVQVLRKDFLHAKVTIRKVRSRINELSDFERKEFEEFIKGVN